MSNDAEFLRRVGASCPDLLPEEKDRLEGLITRLPVLEDLVRETKHPGKRYRIYEILALLTFALFVCGCAFGITIEIGHKDSGSDAVTPDPHPIPSAPYEVPDADPWPRGCPPNCPMGAPPNFRAVSL